MAEGLQEFADKGPDVVVTDVRLPDGTGLDLVREIRSRGLDTGIVVLTMYAGDEQLFAALEAGASAFVAKDVPSDEVVAAARHALVSPRSFAAADQRDSAQVTSRSPPGRGWNGVVPRIWSPRDSGAPVGVVSGTEAGASLPPNGAQITPHACRA